MATAEKRVSLKLDVKADMTDFEKGTEMATFGLSGSYSDVPYSTALKIQASLKQSMEEHGQRMMDLGFDHAKKAGK